MNAAIIAGHEEDVGKRTSVYVHTAHSLISSLISHKKRGFKQIPNDKVCHMTRNSQVLHY